MFRGARAFATTAGRSLRRTRDRRWHDAALSPIARGFHLPLEHAEDLAVQDRAVALYERLVEEALAEWRS
jgi:uncharacterized protein (DUF924 family)